MSKLIECPTCKNKVSIDAQSCPKCGQPITEEIKQNYIKNNISNKNKKWGCLILILIIFVVPAIFSNNKNSSKIKKEEVIPLTNEDSSENKENKDKIEFKHIFDKNPICPNIYGLYLGMNKNSAINILKSIANDNKLDLALEEDKDRLILNLYSSRFMTPTNSKGTVISLSIYVGNKYVMKIDKVVSIFYNIKNIEELGYNTISLFDDFMKNCTNGLNKDDIINQYNNRKGIIIAPYESDMSLSFAKDGNGDDDYILVYY